MPRKRDVCVDSSVLHQHAAPGIGALERHSVRRSGARLLAEQVIDEIATEIMRSQIEHAFRLLTGRRPTNLEREILERLHAEELEMFRSRSRTRRLRWLRPGNHRDVKTIDPARTAAMTVICSTIMNTDAAVMKR